jgi:hypothetical protein
MMQKGVANAAKEALLKPKVEALRGRKVWVDVSSISRSEQRVEESEDEHFIRNMIVQSLVESGVRIVKRDEAEAVLRVVVEVMGVDTVARVFPHTYLPIMYYISHTATVKIHIYAYDVRDSQMITTDDCEGAYSWSDWSFLGLGPFR